MRRFVDLHVHTHHSDSTLTPKQVVDLAHKKGFSAIAITDHDCIDGIEPSKEAGKKCGLEIVPGVELTAEIDNMEMHILGYFVDWKNKWFVDKLEEMRLARVNRIYEMCRCLKGRSLEVDAEKVMHLSGPGSVGRLHLAIVMYNEGYVSTINEAFRKYIGNNSPCYVKKFKLSPREAIDIILSMGGVPVLAHPHIMGRDDLIPELVSYGMKGIEAYHTDHPHSVILHYEDVALEHGLIATGGSDCHGMGKGNILIGRIKIPYAVVERLKEEARNIRVSQNISMGETDLL
ncbi:MAG: PHP domain-containing protein [Candidatus Omnitrophica bacterium]|nr:PHP domain-containing protein [Candidatus Omnitrophota bacterium]